MTKYLTTATLGRKGWFWWCSQSWQRSHEAISMQQLVTRPLQPGSQEKWKLVLSSLQDPNPWEDAAAFMVSLFGWVFLERCTSAVCFHVDCRSSKLAVKMSYRRPQIQSAVHPSVSDWQRRRVDTEMSGWVKRLLHKDKGLSSNLQQTCNVQT